MGGIKSHLPKEFAVLHLMEQIRDALANAASFARGVKTTENDSLADPEIAEGIRKAAEFVDQQCTDLVRELDSSESN